jgi:hypothetical protein
MTVHTQITEGSTSTDSCRLVDIVDGIRFLSDADDKLNSLIEEFDNATSDQIDFIFDEICDRLDEMALPNLIFGSHPCDGADFGFWDINKD